MSQRPHLFDTGLLARRRDRAMRLGYAGAGDFLVRRVAEGLAERIGDVARPFPRVLLHGTGAGTVAQAIRPDGAGLTQIDVSPLMAEAAARALPAAETRVITGETLDAERGTYDLALSVLQLHAANDPVGLLIQMRQALKPDGLLLGALFGGQTLAELRRVLAEAESEVTGGLSPRIAPMGDVRDLGALLGRAGLVMPVADIERISVSYGCAHALMRDLRLMGETSVLAQRLRRPTRRTVLDRAAELYAQHFSDKDGRIRATFEVVYLSAWAPGPDQPQPKRPGSATHRLADALGTFEIPGGAKAGR